jgi:hypothetical protein
MESKKVEYTDSDMVITRYWGWCGQGKGRKKKRRLG